MSIAGRWRALSRLPAPRGRDAMPGVYQVADAEKQIIYIGQSATDVPNRLRQHLSRAGCVAEAARYWRYEYSRVPQAREAELLAAYEAEHGHLPPCNTARPLVRDAGRRATELFGSTTVTDP